jgi:hypothetical protein
MNCKIVVIKGPWWREAFSHLSFLMPWELVSANPPGGNYHYINFVQEKKQHLSGEGRPRHMVTEHGQEYAEEDISAGGDYVKLLLLPKPFTPDFRENWELYRTEYWEKENERRAELRKRVKRRQKEIAKEEGGWLWWTGWRGWKKARGVGGRLADIEKSHHHGHSRSLSTQNSLKDKKRRSSLLKDRGRDGSHSRSSSRSTTPTTEIDERAGRNNLDERQRRWSNSTTGSTSDRRRKKGAAAVGMASAGRPVRLTPAGPRPPTPNAGNPLEMQKRLSTLSTTESFSGTEGESPGAVLDERHMAPSA